MAVLDTIKVYLTITDMQVDFVLCPDEECLNDDVNEMDTDVLHTPQLICTFLQKASDRLTSTESTEFTR